VRVSAVAALTNYPGEQAVAALHGALKDSSYRVVAWALRSLSKADSAHAQPLLLSYLDVPSHRNVIAASALRSLAAIDTLKGVELSLVKGRKGQPQEMRFASLGILSRHGKGRNDVLHLLESIAGEKPSFVRGFAVRILGDIGGADSIPVLERIAAGGDERSAPQAKASIEKIRKRTGETK
jgi:HEAT repeat protein